MERDFLTVSPLESCARALAVMDAAGADELLVVEGSRLVGTVSELDIRRHAPEPTPAKAANGHDSLFPHVKVAGVMSYAPVTVSPAASLAEAAAVMRERGLTSLAVTDQGRAVGVLTMRVILGRLIELLGGTSGTDTAVTRGRTQATH